MHLTFSYKLYVRASSKDLQACLVILEHYSAFHGKISCYLLEVRGRILFDISLGTSITHRRFENRIASVSVALTWICY